MKILNPISFPIWHRLAKILVSKNEKKKHKYTYIDIFVYFGSKFSLMHVLLKTRELLTEAIFLFIFSIFIILCFFQQLGGK